jgi:hypothetical protein
MRAAQEVNVTDADSFRIGLARLSLLVDGTADDQELWLPEEFGSIFRHQLTAPLCSDLAGLTPQLGEELASLRTPDGRPVATFGDLLRHPAPPLALLELVKEFAKTSRQPGRRQLPPEVASMLYYLSIGIALFRCDHRLSSLSDAALQEGFRWASAQPWADEATRDMLGRAEACFLITAVKLRPSEQGGTPVQDP